MFDLGGSQSDGVDVKPTGQPSARGRGGYRGSRGRGRGAYSSGGRGGKIKSSIINFHCKYFRWVQPAVYDTSIAMCNILHSRSCWL